MMMANFQNKIKSQFATQQCHTCLVVVPAFSKGWRISVQSNCGW